MHNPDANRIKIFLPTTLEIYATHYRKRAAEGVITKEQAEALIGLLTNVKTSNKESIIEMEYAVLNKETYYDRNTRVVENADRLFAFQVNGSGGVQDTIDKARKFGLEVVLKQYTIDN